MNTPSPPALGTVALTVSDLDLMRRFYEQVIGLSVLEEGDGRASLGPGGGPAVVELVADPDAPRRPPRSTGLFHLAILVPDRTELARSVLRLSTARWALTGASDHLVSEALYLDDPEGNGIEIYRDRPRSDWESADGELRMATLPLDLDDVMSELGDDRVVPMAPGTRLGHVHLQVADLDAAEGFYRGELGMDVMVRSYPGARFLSWNGYHHHVGLNTWASEGAPAPPPGSLGLRHFEVLTPGADELGELTDPSGNRVVAREA